MYICLDALKKGFVADCRKVIGLDGCFFKGDTNEELLCAIGRDANNQMYPIAWAVELRLKTYLPGTSFVIFCVEMWELVMDLAGCSSLTNKRLTLILTE